MKKNSLRSILFCLILILFAFSGANGQDALETEAPVDPVNLLKTADEEIFVRSAFVQDFSEAQGFVNELPNADSIHQYYIYNGLGTDLLMSMLPSETTIRTGNKRLTFDQARKDAFHVTYSVQQSEDIPSGGGGKCWIRYSNVALLGKGRESGVILYPGDKAYALTPVDGEIAITEIADLSGLKPKKQIKFDFIRLDGVIYVYAEGKFLFSYADQIKEAVSFESGAELSTGGNRVRCDFDDFGMRTK